MTTNELAPASPDSIVAAFLAGRRPTTLRAYRQSLADFAAWLGVPGVGDAARVILTGTHGDANRTAHAYASALRERGLSAATVNQRLAALRSLVKLARMQGLVPWGIDVPGQRVKPYRDTRGPGRIGVRAVLSAAADATTPIEIRDLAILRLLADLALRRGEVVSLDLEHVDLAAGTVAVLGKGDTGRETLTLPAPTASALAAWIAARGGARGPLFHGFKLRAGTPIGTRLTDRSVHRIVARAGRRAGLRVLRPHGLRHAAITQALELTRGDVRAVQRYSRHADLATLLRYDDAREDKAGEVAAQVAAWR